MTEIKQQALDKMLEEMNTPHNAVIDYIHNSLCPSDGIGETNNMIRELGFSLLKFLALVTCLMGLASMIWLWIESVDPTIVVLSIITSLIVLAVMMFLFGG